MCDDVEFLKHILKHKFNYVGGFLKVNIRR